MRVSQLNTTREVLHQMEALNRKQLVLQRKTATGMEVERPSDNPAAAARVIRIDTERQQAMQLRQNLHEAETHLHLGSKNLQAFQDLVTRTREIAALSGGTTGPDKMAAYAKEMEGLTEQAFHLANSTYQGQFLFGGLATDAPPFDATRNGDGLLTAATYQGANETTRIQAGQDFVVATRLDGTQARGLEDVITTFVAVRDALAAGDKEALNGQAGALGAHEDALVFSQAGLNGDLTRIEWTRLREDERFLALGEDRGRVADADLAQVITQLNQASVAYQAALQTSTMFLNHSLLNFI
jgi:flagellar hook-associated protein 3 FlgL